MFERVSPQVSFPEAELALLEFWRENRVFETSVEQSRGKPTFIFYEGPPTANGMPHAGHLLTRVGKDVFLRYKTMCGFHVPRRAGWDTHGLPVEVEVEKSLGIHGKEEIEKYGVEAFTTKCVESVFRYVNEWRRMTERIAFWLDLDDAYATFHKSYVESVWWALSELHRKDLLYRGYKVVWWWPQGGTALSAGEVGQGYRTVDDPSVVVRFRLADEENTSVLSWTTTPWTLTSNIALAVKPTAAYAVCDTGSERLIVAEQLRADVMGDVEHEVVRTLPGSELIGKRYLPTFDYAEPEGGRAYEITDADFVTLDTGTGIVQMAPAFGEDDFRECKAKGLGFLQLVKPDGTFVDEVTDFAGRFCKEADPDIVRNLDARGLLWSKRVYRHEYPHCWRAMDDPLIQYARKSWFVRTTREVDRLIANNQQITWRPEHIRDGRFGDFLRNNVDWALSRERWWGTPLPIWINDETGELDVVSSADEILERNPEAFADFEAARATDSALSEHLMVHKPWIDKVTWTKPGEAGVYRRVPEVIDCWFDAGSMPFAQWGYPHENREKFEAAFPADFITEALDQTRGWFYSLLAISTLLFEEEQTPHPFRSCVVLGLIVAEDGAKLSKSLKNYEDPSVLIDRHGADPVRWTLYTSVVPGQSTRFGTEAIAEGTREFLLKIWNVYSFFCTYAAIDGWRADAERPALADRAGLDRWVLAEWNATVGAVRGALDNLESHTAARRLHRFADSLSNWYVRRSRSRFWAEGDGADKNAAFATLFEVLAEMAGVMAPFTPFLAETLYQGLTRKADPDAPVSVHLTSFPEGVAEREDEELRASTQTARDLVALGQRVRATERIRVRQPLGEAIVVLADDTGLRGHDAVIGEELNVRKVTVTDTPETYVEFDLVPNFRALGPKLGKRMPLCKKALAAADGSALYLELEEHGKVTLDIDGDPVDLGPDELEIRFSAREGYAAAGERGIVVVLDTRIDEELLREGLAREVVNRIQRTRKTLDLPYEARIRVTYAADDALADAIAAHRDAIAGEVLATDLEPGDVPDGDDVHATEVEGHALAFRIAL